MRWGYGQQEMEKSIGNGNVAFPNFEIGSGLYDEQKYRC